METKDLYIVHCLWRDFFEDWELVELNLWSGAKSKREQREEYLDAADDKSREAFIKMDLPKKVSEMIFKEAGGNRGKALKIFRTRPGLRELVEQYNLKSEFNDAFKNIFK